MKPKTTLTLAVGIFTIVAILHLVRYLLGWELIINECIIPQWTSILGTIIPAVLAYQLLKMSN